MIVERAGARRGNRFMAWRSWGFSGAPGASPRCSVLFLIVLRNAFFLIIPVSAQAKLGDAEENSYDTGDDGPRDGGGVKGFLDRSEPEVVGTGSDLEKGEGRRDRAEVKDGFEGFLFPGHGHHHADEQGSDPKQAEEPPETDREPSLAGCPQVDQASSEEQAGQKESFRFRICFDICKLYTIKNCG